MEEVKNQQAKQSSERATTAAQSVFGNVSAASTNYGIDKFNASQGHGFAAERANHLNDLLHGKDAQILGDDNALNGADRIVDGVQIQSKYCATGSRCVAECFNSAGEFRYLDKAGKPMQIEVPSDKYEAALDAMRDKIIKGKIPGVSNPDEAENIIRKGSISYEQAKNIAKAGTIDSLKLDATNGAIICLSAFGLSATVNFAVSIWRGEEYKLALKNAAVSGLKVGGTAFATSVISSQLSRTGLNSLLVNSSEALVRLMGPKASAVLVNAFRSGANIYGAAAMKSAAKLLRGNVITAAVSVVVLSSADVINIFRGRISGAQMFKNITTTAASVGAGTAGWVGGAAAGAAIGSAVPVVGTAVGAFVGGLVGSIASGAAGGMVTNKVLDQFIEDDAVAMQHIIEQEFAKVAEEFLLSSEEAEMVADFIASKGAGVLKDMFAASDREEFARDLLLERVEELVSEREQISEIDSTELLEAMRSVLEDVADAQAADAAEGDGENEGDFREVLVTGQAAGAAARAVGRTEE